MREFRKNIFISNNDTLKSFSLRASSIIQVEDKYLMVLNKSASKYKHPGGHTNLKESLLEGLKRELKEEIGLEIENTDPEEIFFDVILKDGNAMINSLFQIQIDIKTAKEIIASSPLPTKLFQLDELNQDNTWKSEITTIKHHKYQKTNKNNLPKWIDTLKYLTNILKKNDIKYYLSASGLEYILGSKIYPYDIDLFMSEENVKKVYNLLKESAVSDLHKWKDQLLEFQGEYNETPFEICEWGKTPKKLIHKKFKDFEVSIIE